MPERHVVTITCEVESEPGKMPDAHEIVAKLKGVFFWKPGLVGKGTKVAADTMHVEVRPKESE